MKTTLHPARSEGPGRTLAVVLAALALSGCAAFKGYPERVTDPDTDIAKLAATIDADAIARCVKDNTVSCRNQFVSARMYAIDLRFSQFEESMFRQTREAGFTATITTLGLTTAAAASTGGTSQVLAGLSALIIGGREAFQKEILSERTVIAIHTAMRSRRAEVAVRLRSGMLRGPGEYPIGLALSDLESYYNAGTVLGALVGITESVGADAKRAETLLQTLSFKQDSAAKTLRTILCGGKEPCGELDKAAVERMKRDCWPLSNVPADTLVTDFMIQPRFAPERVTVGTCLSP